MTTDFLNTQPLMQASRPPPRRPWMTLLLALIIITVTATGAYLSGNWLQVSNDVMLRLGANVPMATLDQFGAWRLLTAKLLFQSPVVLAVFLPFFVMAAVAFERRHGAIALLVYFVVASVIASAATLYFIADELKMSAGAGGPAWAIATAMLVSLRDPLRDKWFRPQAKHLAGLPYVALCAFGAYVGTIDMASMGAGVLLGLVCGWYLRRADAAMPTHQFARLAIIAAIGGCLSTIALMRAPTPSYFLSEVRQFVQDAKNYTSELNGLNAQVQALTDQALAGSITRPALAERMTQDLIPKWMAAEKRWTTRSWNPNIPDGPKLAPMKSYVTHRTRFLQASAVGWANEDTDAFAQASVHFSKMHAAQLALAAGNDGKVSPAAAPRK